MLAFPIGIYDRKSIFPAYGVRCVTQIVKVTLEIAPILLSVYERNRVENDVTMQVVTVGVRTDDGFVLVAQQPPRKFHASFVCLFRGHFAR